MIKFILGAVIKGILGKIITLALIFGAVTYFTGGRSIEIAKSLLAGTDGNALAGLSLPENLSLPDSLGFGGDAPAQPEFFEVKARVSAVGRSCRLLDFRSATVTRTEAMPCERAAALLNRPEFAGHEMREFRNVEYIYYAPNGTDVLTGTFLPKQESGARYAVGAVIDLKVNADDPTESTPL